MLFQADHDQQLFDLPPPLGRIAHATLQGPKIEELLRREAGVSVEFLRKKSDRSPEVGEVLIPNRHISVHDRAACRLQQSGQNAEQRGLAGTVRTEKADHARLQVETDAA